MEWTPTYKVIDGTAIADNLLAYLMANQTDALAYFSPSATLKPLKSVTAKITDPEVPMLPSIGVELEQEQPQDDGGDVITTVYAVTFEMWVESSSPTTVVANAKAYKNAVVSMIQECPDATVTGDTSVRIEDRLRPETDIEAVRTLEQENHFFQKIQIRTQFKLTAGYQA